MRSRAFGSLSATPLRVACAYCTRELSHAVIGCSRSRIFHAPEAGDHPSDPPRAPRVSSGTKRAAVEAGFRPAVSPDGALNPLRAGGAQLHAAGPLSLPVRALGGGSWGRSREPWGGGSGGAGWKPQGCATENQSLPPAPRAVPLGGGSDAVRFPHASGAADRVSGPDRGFRHDSGAEFAAPAQRLLRYAPLDPRPLCGNNARPTGRPRQPAVPGRAAVSHRNRRLPTPPRWATALDASEASNEVTSFESTT